MRSAVEHNRVLARRPLVADMELEGNEKKLFLLSIPEDKLR
jgi:hypothetical protein